VKVGTPIWEAVQLCPEVVYVKRDFYWPNGDVADHMDDANNYDVCDARGKVCL
jgi:hypothetical protein